MDQTSYSKKQKWAPKSTISRLIPLFHLDPLSHQSFKIPLNSNNTAPKSVLEKNTSINSLSLLQQIVHNSQTYLLIPLTKVIKNFFLLELCNIIINCILVSLIPFHIYKNLILITIPH